uniref:Uncharacterized protein n=1 Tax=Arundo donax TaxID=35708 RepID=A0A0A8ZR34_ARUDO
MRHIMRRFKGLASHHTDKSPDGRMTRRPLRIGSSVTVMDILYTSAEELIRMNFISLSSAREMWEYLQQRFQHSSALLSSAEAPWSEAAGIVDPGVLHATHICSSTARDQSPVLGVMVVIHLF